MILLQKRNKHRKKGVQRDFLRDSRTGNNYSINGGILTPRTKPTKTIEHRISFSNYERERIDKLLKMSEENIYIDGITSTLQAGSSLLAGGGMLWAAAVFGLWKAPAIGAWVKDKVGDLVDPGGALDNIADSLLDGSPISLRREAQELARRRGELVSQEASYCTIAASTYDAALCSNVFEMKTQYYADVILFRQKVRDHNVAHGDSSDFIYQGLGDIDPNADSNPETTRDGIQAVNPSSSIGIPVSYVNLGMKGYVQKTEQECIDAFNRTWDNQFYSLEVGSHWYNYRRGYDGEPSQSIFNIEWDGAQWIYAMAGSYNTWKAAHQQRMAAEEEARKEAYEAAGENYAERPGYWDADSGTWKFDN